MVVLFVCVPTPFLGCCRRCCWRRSGSWTPSIRSVQLARGALPRITGVLLVACVIVSLPSLPSLAFLGGVQGLANPRIRTGGEV
jgi:hypothetical protein